MKPFTYSENSSTTKLINAVYDPVDRCVAGIIQQSYTINRLFQCTSVKEDPTVVGEPTTINNISPYEWKTGFAQRVYL